MPAGKTTKLALTTTEPWRPVHSRNAMGRAVKDQRAPAASGPLVLKLGVPTDVAEDETRVAVGGDVAGPAVPPHTLFSRVFQLPVWPALKVEFTSDSLQLASETSTVSRGVTELHGIIERLHGFSGPLQIGLNPLPAVNRSEKVDVAADQEQFALEIEPVAFNEEMNRSLSRRIVTYRRPVADSSIGNSRSSCFPSPSNRGGAARVATLRGQRGRHLVVCCALHGTIHHTGNRLRSGLQPRSAVVLPLAPSRSRRIGHRIEKPGGQNRRLVRFCSAVLLYKGCPG